MMDGSSPITKSGDTPQTPMIPNENESPKSRSSQRSNVDDEGNQLPELSIINNNSKPNITEQAVADADKFLQGLQGMIQEDRIAAVCTSELNAIVEEVCSSEDPDLELDEDGALCKVVRSPPFGDKVVQLFASRSNPIINPRRKRKTVTEMWEEASQK
jgi:hypothetical protein